MTPTSTPTRATTWRERLRQAAELATTPLLPDDYLTLIDPLWSSRELRGRVVEVRRETADAATIVIRPGRQWADHSPGQYVRIGVDVDGVRLWRAYSLTSVPGRPDGLISITVKALPDGKVSRRLVHGTKAGTIVRLNPAEGDFVLPTPRPGRILFLTAGSGITPAMGMFRSLLAAGGQTEIVWVHSALTRDDVIFGAELRRHAAAGRITLHERHTDSDGLLTMDQLAALVPDWAERQTWACGPAGLLDAAEAHWAAAGRADALHTERFRAAILGEPGDGGTVGFTRSGHTVEADGTTTLLDAGEAAGVLMPSGCRMGICFGCVVPLRSGQVRDLRNGDLTTAVPGEGAPLVQTCVSAAAGACELEL